MTAPDDALATSATIEGHEWRPSAATTSSLGTSALFPTPTSAAPARAGGDERPAGQGDGPDLAARAYRQLQQEHDEVAARVDPQPAPGMLPPPRPMVVPPPQPVGHQPPPGQVRPRRERMRLTRQPTDLSAWQAAPAPGQQHPGPRPSKLRPAGAQGPARNNPLAVLLQVVAVVAFLIFFFLSQP